MASGHTAGDAGLVVRTGGELLEATEKVTIGFLPSLLREAGETVATEEVRIDFLAILDAPVCDAGEPELGAEVMVEVV